MGTLCKLCKGQGRARVRVRAMQVQQVCMLWTLCKTPAGCAGGVRRVRGEQAMKADRGTYPEPEGQAGAMRERRKRGAMPN